MLMTDLEINERLISPENLLNRLHKSTNRSISNLPIIDIIKVSIPSLPSNDTETKTAKSEVSPANRELTIDDLIDSVETKINIGKAHTSAIDVLNHTLDTLRMRLNETETPEKLSRIASDMSKIITNSTSSKKEDEMAKTQVIIWKPMMIAIDDMNVIHAND